MKEMGVGGGGGGQYIIEGVFSKARTHMLLLLDGCNIHHPEYGIQNADSISNRHVSDALVHWQLHKSLCALRRLCGWVC